MSAASDVAGSQVTSATPYAWPFDGPLAADDVALVLIDMQTDFCGLGGYVAQMGYDVSVTRAPIEPLQKVLAAARAAGVRVIHTREGHRPSLADLPANKRWRSRQAGGGIGIGDAGPCGRILTRGEPGWNLIPELAPLPGEDIIDKPGKGTFANTDMDLVLRSCGVKRLILGGITTDVCVHTTMREANDLGYECLLLEDGTAATDPANHAAAIKMVHMQGGVFGATACVDDVARAFDALPRPLDPESAQAKEALRVATMQAGECHTAGSVPAATPSAFTWPAGAAALVMIDWQKDFCHPGGFGGSLGNDVSPLIAAIPAAARVLAAARAASMPVIHTLEAHLPDLSDCPASKKRRCPAIGEPVAAGGRALVRGEPCNALVDELAHLPGEKVIHKPGKGAFFGTDLDVHLRASGVSHLIFTGVTTAGTSSDRRWQIHLQHRNLQP